MKDGIYFNLDEQEYHSLNRLSSSGIRKLFISPEDFWVSSWMNPEKQEFTSTALHAGKAYHKAILEPDSFFDEYCIAFDKKNLPDGVLCTAKDLKDHLKILGLPTTGVKDELIKRIQTVDSSVPILDVLKQEYLDKNEGKTEIAEYLYDQIQMTGKIIADHDQIGSVFTDGFPEVSVLWTDRATGIPMKARFDWWKEKTIIDLKTFSNKNGSNINKSIMNSIAKYDYLIQAATYIEAAKYFRPEGYSDDPNFLFIFCQTGAASLVRGKLLDKDSNAMLYAGDKYRQGLEIFQYYYNKHKQDRWICYNNIKTIRDEDFPLWMFD